TVMKEVCCDVCRQVQECCVKNVCETTYETVNETCYKECVKKVSKPVCTMKTVQKKCGEWACESYCVPGKTTTKWVDTCECCFNPCTCQTVTKHHKVKVCCEGPAEVRTRKVWHERIVCEQVPCTTYVTECHVERVPYTVCKKVPHTCVKKVPYTVCRTVHEKVVKQVPCTVHRTVTEVVKKQVPYTTTRCVRGAYVGPEGCTSPCEKPGYTFQEGAQVCEERQYTTTRMVQEVCRKQVPYTVMRTVQEE